VSILFQKIFAEKSGKKCVSILYQKMLPEQEVKFQKKWEKMREYFVPKNILRVNTTRKY